MNLTKQIKVQAQELGFELVGILPVEPSQTIGRYEQWLKDGYAGEMGYLEKHLPLKRDPRQILPEAQSIIALAINYYTLDPPKPLAEDPSRGQISRYAWGTDYHGLIRSKLDQLATFIQKAAEERVKTGSM